MTDCERCGQPFPDRGNGVTKKRFCSEQCRSRQKKSEPKWKEYDKQYRRLWRANPRNRDKVLAARQRIKDKHYSREYMKFRRLDQQFRAREKVWQANYRERHKDAIKIRQLVIRYRLRPEDYTLLLEHQKGLCAICGTMGRLQIDHDHKTGLVRGLLCSRCNRALASIENGFLARALTYINSYPAKELVQPLKT